MKRFLIMPVVLKAVGAISKEFQKAASSNMDRGFLQPLVLAFYNMYNSFQWLSAHALLCTKWL
jgi:hypothetical protein